MINCVSTKAVEQKESEVVKLREIIRKMEVREENMKAELERV
jgi:hypothetical protein